MKNITTIISLVFITALFSCKKDYRCKCTKTYTGSSTSLSTDDGVYTYRATKAKAIDKCDDNETTGSDLGGDYTRNCEIE